MMGSQNNENLIAGGVAWKTKQMLQEYGNVLSETHVESLGAVGQLYQDLMCGSRRGRYAVALPTGAGKTTTIIALCYALENLDIDQGLLVCAEKVEALCELKRDLEKNGVPDEKIGLVHSFTHDPDFDREQPVNNTASEASTPPAKVDSKKYLLVTHQKIRKSSDLGQFTYHGQARDLTIWDESLISAKGWSLGIKEVQKEIGAWTYAFEHDADTGKVSSDHAKSLHSYLSSIYEQLSTLSQEMERDGAQVICFKKTELSSHEEEGALKEVLGPKYASSVLMTLFDVAELELRAIRTAHQDAFIRYEIVVPEGLENVVILDASYPIRELARLDQTIQLVKTPFRKSYAKVMIHHMESRSGRDYIESEFQHGYDNSVADEICRIVKNVRQHNPEDGILVFTFKKRKVDVVGSLKLAMCAEGLDVDVVNNKGRPLINFLTWGMETSLNTYSHCKHVIFAGVLHLPLSDLAARSVGQMRDLCSLFEVGEIDRIHQAEQAHMLYQALSRGACRNTDNGQAEPMDVYLFYRNFRVIKPLLSEVMPSVQWAVYEPKFMIQKRITKTEQLASQFEEILNQSEQDKVSSRLLRDMLKTKGWAVTSSQFRKAGDKLVRGGGWVRKGRSFVNIFKS